MHGQGHVAPRGAIGHDTMLHGDTVVPGEMYTGPTLGCRMHVASETRDSIDDPDTAVWRPCLTAEDEWQQQGRGHEEERRDGEDQKDTHLLRP